MPSTRQVSYDMVVDCDQAGRRTAYASRAAPPDRCFKKLRAEFGNHDSAGLIKKECFDNVRADCVRIKSSTSTRARTTGLEPATTGSTVRYSNQLSYVPSRGLF